MSGKPREAGFNKSALKMIVRRLEVSRSRLTDRTGEETLCAHLKLYICTVFVELSYWGGTVHR